MPTVVDELVIRLGLDTKGFTSGQKQATSSFQKTKEESISVAKSMEESGKQAAEFFGKIRNAALGMFAAFTAGRGIEQFTRQTIATNAELGRTAQNLSMSGRALSAWQKAVELAGGSAGEVTETLEGLRKTYQDMLMGQQPQNSAALSMLGLTKEDLADPEKRLDILIQKVRTFAANPRHTRAQSFEVAREAGMSKGLINLALSPDSEKLLAEGSANAVTESQIKAAQKVQTAFTDLQQKWDKLGNSLLEKFEPQIDEVIKSLGKLADWLQAHPDFVKNVFAGALLAVGLLSKAIIGNLIALALSPLTFALGGVSKAAVEAEASVALLGNTGKLLGLLGILMRVSGILSALGIVLFPTAANAQEEKDGEQYGIAPAPKGLSDRVYGSGVNPFESHPQEFWQQKTPDGILLRGLKRLFGVKEPDTSEYMDSSGHMVPKSSTFDPAIAGGPGGLFSRLESTFGLPAGLLDSTWAAESSRGSDLSTSSAGAKGHFQFLDGTAKQYGVKNPYDLQDSSTGAAKYFNYLLEHFKGDKRKAIAGYNWGEGNVDKDVARYGPEWDQHLPDETTKYLSKVTRGLASQSAGGVGPQSSNQTHIGQIVVHTAATDAKGIARDIGTEMRKYGFVAQANMGLS